MRYMVEHYGLKSEGDIIALIDNAFSCHEGDGWLDVTPWTESGRPSRKYCGFTIHVTTLYGRPAVCVYGCDSCARAFCRHIDDAFAIGDAGRAAIVAYCDCTRAGSIGF